MKKSQLHDQFNHRWHSEKVRVFNSPIHGLGVIASADISRGEIVFVYGGVIVPKSEIKTYWKEMGHVGIQIDHDFFICPTSREELEKQGVVNHSCDPNVGFKNQIELVAIRDIKTGEEITFDYAFCESYMDAFTCNCGAASCRKTITQDDWKNPELRKKYAGYFSNYLAK